MFRYICSIVILMLAFDGYFQVPPEPPTTECPGPDGPTNNSVYVIDSKVPSMQYELDAVQGVKLAHGLHPYDPKAALKTFSKYFKDKYSGNWKTVVGCASVFIPSEQDYFITLYDGLIDTNVTLID